MRPNLLQRLRQRQSYRSVITDGPLITDEMLVRTPETINISTPEESGEHVLVVDVSSVNFSTFFINYSAFEIQRNFVWHNYCRRTD